MILTLNFGPVVYRLTPELTVSFYGICLAIGIGLFNYYAENNLKKNIPELTAHQLSVIYALAICGSIFGARLWWAINEIFQGNVVDLYSLIALWQGGFSILGALMGSLVVIPYLNLINIPAKKFLATVLIYLPIAQSIGRIGCLLVGCCHGATSNGFLSIVYTNYDSLAPCFVSLHPTQFYSSLFYCLLFIILKGVQKLNVLKLNNDWLIIKIYFLSAALERFMIDFWRGDRQIIPDVMGGFFSTHQLIAMIIISFMVILIMSDCIQKKNFNSTRPR